MKKNESEMPVKPANFIQGQLKFKGIKQQDIAKSAGVHKVTVSMTIHGTRSNQSVINALLERGIKVPGTLIKKNRPSIECEADQRKEVA